MAAAELGSILECRQLARTGVPAGARPRVWANALGLAAITEKHRKYLHFSPPLAPHFPSTHTCVSNWVSCDRDFLVPLLTQFSTLVVYGPPIGRS